MFMCASAYYYLHGNQGHALTSMQTHRYTAICFYGHNNLLLLIVPSFGKWKKKTTNFMAELATKCTDRNRINNIILIIAESNGNEKIVNVSIKIEENKTWNGKSNLKTKKKKRKEEIHWQNERLWFFTLRVRARNNSSIANLTKTLRFPLFLIFSSLVHGSTLCIPRLYVRSQYFVLVSLFCVR